MDELNDPEMGKILGAVNFHRRYAPGTPPLSQ